MSSQALKAVATNKPQNALATLQGYFNTHKSQISAALPKHLNPDRMCRLALTAFSQNGALAKCDPKTIFGSVVIASQLGLEIGVAGQGYLVPYKGKATFVPGWQGYVDLVSRSGRATVWTGAVYEGDDFDYALGDAPFIRHRPSGEDDPQKLVCTYAVGRVNGSQWPVIEIWPVKKIWRHRDRNNKVGDSHYSFANPEMYARKVPLLQVIKYMPKSIELTNALALESAAEEGKGAVIDGDFVRIEDEPQTPNVDPETGEISGDHIPQFDTASAVAAIKKAKTLEELDKTWKEIAADFTSTNRAIPIDVEAARNDRQETLRQQ